MEKYMFRTVPRPVDNSEARALARNRIAIVRRCLHAWNQDRFAFLSHDVDAAVHVDWSESRAPYRGVYSGHSGWLDLFGEIRAGFENLVCEAHDFVVAGPHIAVPNTTRMRGRDGVEVVARSTVVFTFLCTKVARLRLYQDEAAARAAIGA
jgi:hypothetical protein